MRCFPNLLVLAVCFLVGATALASKKDDKLREEALKDPKKNSKKKGKDSKGNEKADPSKEDADKMSIPMVPGHDSIGLKIPVRSKDDGHLQMLYTIELANMPDKNHMKMVDARVESFKENGEHEMFIDIPNSIIDLNTRVISTQQSVTIKHSEFELTGHSMEFNTVTKQGTLGGGIRMTIYNLKDEEAPAPEKKENE